MNVSDEIQAIIVGAAEYAAKRKQEYVTPEHFMYIASFQEFFQIPFEECGGDIEQFQNDLETYIEENIMTVEKGQPDMTIGLQNIFVQAQETAKERGKRIIEFIDFLVCLLDMENGYIPYYVQKQRIDISDLISEVIMYTEMEKWIAEEEEEGLPFHEKLGKWDKYVECLNETAAEQNPLIGREDEIERTIQILCRKDKNNPLHIGEPGVGKTALVYGLARKINEGKVPEPLKDAKIYAVDLGGMLAGTQYRGDFERRFKEMMEGVLARKNSIVYLDEIHNIVGAGAVNESSMDAANMLKPYLVNGKVRFIGATTYEEYKKYFSKSKSLVRRFQNVDVHEPSESEACMILKGLKNRYEKFHGIKYGKGVLEYAVSMSAKYINERYLPDKAIDLIDEAGAYRRLHPLDQKTQTVSKKLIDEVLSKICNIPKQMVEQEEVKNLESLEKRISEEVFGQEEAIQEVCNAVKFSKAGLSEEGKPLASLLFVGPTGVGKTQVARTLANQLGIRLIRFDMSEYAEKHAVAKLIGAPAGYVGYEEGGLLTEEVRKNPHAVLLLDEIEKAHSDIYNVLLQVMDYATLTDNQGRKADFRNIILIMTSNAGASKVGKEMIGFGHRVMTGDAIQEAVKKTFQPEFRNRLNKIVVFKDINDAMAEQITKKKIRELTDKLLEKKVILEVDKEALKRIMKSGISREYGAREIERAINRDVKPLLVEPILFGKLKKGGKCRLVCKDEKLMLDIV